MENFPLMTKEKIEWWRDNKYLLQKKYGLIENPENFIVIIMRFNGYKSLPAGTRSGSVDDYRCFDDIKDRNNCIYNDMAMIISGDINKKIFYRLDNKLYSETPDGALTLLRE